MGEPIWDDYVAFALNPPDVLRESQKKTPLIRNDVVSCHGLVRINIKQTEESTAAEKERDGEYRMRTSGDSSEREGSNQHLHSARAHAHALFKPREKKKRREKERERERERVRSAHLRDPTGSRLPHRVNSLS